jgi:hypothetical protein
MGKTIYGCVVAAVGILSSLQAQTTVLYETGFERAEGYDPNLDLAGQRGWLLDGTGGNGLLQEWFPGFGQQAYIGFTPPATDNAVTAVWRPVNFNPVPANNPIVRFSTKMEIVRSTAGGDDDFRWAIYNNIGARLFGVSFETRTGEIWYQNEDLEFHTTGWTFEFDGTFDFEIWMDFARNSWTARLNDIVLANAQPITLTNTTSRTFGDADAVWFINNPQGVGNNFMAFDNYRVTAENRAAIPGFLEPVGRTAEGFFRFWIHGQKGVKYAVEYTTDFQEWPSLGEYVNEAGSFLFEDDQADGDRYRYYRLREIPQ